MNWTNPYNDELSDEAAIGNLIIRERAARDQARWRILSDCYHHDSQLRLSWFQGSGSAFIAASRRMLESGTLVCHQLNQPLVFLSTDRALGEVGMVVYLRAQLERHTVDVTCFSRLIYRIERREHKWGILSIDALYHKDNIVPVIPDARIEMNLIRLAGYRTSYQYLSYVMEENGYPIDQDLPGDDQPKSIERIRADSERWLGAADQSRMIG